ncbi:MAG: sarcosine oxidase subunit alpha family protein [Alphaproteobacteria bacterium]
MSGFRLPHGGRIDRGRRIRFRFDGVEMNGYPGDTLASALLASGVRTVARSFKYHRPRGIVSAGAEEPNALVRLGRGEYAEPNVRATVAELYDGLEAQSLNAWPSLKRDLGAATGLFAPLLGAGFYYKTFMPSQRAWQRLFEPAIRRMAGLGRAPQVPDGETYDHVHRHCDVLVVGGGPAGLMAARGAARTGARVVFCDEQSEFGGSLLSDPAHVDGRSGTEWAGDAITELHTLSDVTVLRRASAFGYYDHNYVCIAQRRTDHLPVAERGGGPRQRLWHVRARQVVLATGAHERPLVFPGNDLPGVMLAGAVRTYLNRYAVAPGRRLVIATGNDGGYRLAFDWLAAGLPVAAVLDLRTGVDADLPREVWRRGVSVLQGHGPVGAMGRHGLTAIEAAALDPTTGGLAGQPFRIECDVLAVSGGWNPAVHLFAQSQGRLRWDDRIACFVPALAAQSVRCAGAANGTFGLRAALAEGLAAGTAAARDSGFVGYAETAVPQVDEVEEAPPRTSWVLPGHGKRFVDLQNDVTADDIGTAAREGFDSVELLKRYTTAGMGTDQGKTSNVNALALLAANTGRSIPKTGTTTFRAPYTPITFGLLGGRSVGPLFEAARRTPTHAWAVASGAMFEDVGQWKRARWFPRPGETMRDGVARECLAVRNAVGLLDASTLGKIELCGPDAGIFLDRIYTNRFSDLAVGHCRYGLMCREDGMVFDDGVTTRLAADRFLMTTTTGNAAAVLDWLEEWRQTEWPHLRVFCTSVTEQWATVTLAGPRAREVLRALEPDLAVAPGNFPFMSVREAMVAGMPARILRVSFTGELSFEINVAWHHGAALWEAALAAGRPFGVMPYGTEAMHVLRAEKGYIVVGHETDGSVTPNDLGMDWIVSKRKDFLGRRSLARADTARGDRKQFVGLRPVEPDQVVAEGAQIIDAPELPPPTPMLGHVTSSYWSPTLGSGFALGLVRNGRARHGETVLAWDRGRTTEMRIVPPVFYDPQGERRDG